jgi:hypothetical protein
MEDIHGRETQSSTLRSISFETQASRQQSQPDANSICHKNSNHTISGDTKKNSGTFSRSCPSSFDLVSGSGLGLEGNIFIIESTFFHFGAIPLIDFVRYHHRDALRKCKKRIGNRSFLSGYNRTFEAYTRPQYSSHNK